MLVCVEALVTALQSIDLCSRQEAEHMFAEGVVWTQEEFDNKWKQAMKSSARAVRRSYTHTHASVISVVLCWLWKL